MVEWSTPQEISKDAGKRNQVFKMLHASLIIVVIVDVFSKLVFSLFGVYLWELFVTWDFEWCLLTGRRKFRWPLVSLTTFPSDFQ